MPLIVITVSLVGLLYEVKKKFRGSIVRKNSKLKETGRIMEAQINNRIGMVCGTFVALQMPAFLVRIISFIVVTLCQRNVTTYDFG